MAESRLIGAYPVIGIRPTIDGRRGPIKVRQSLEDQTMGMAKAAAKLFEENIKYSNGEPVKVVIADTTIGRVAEAAACEEKFRREGVAITLTVTPCWCYGSETMDMDPTTIKGVWGLNATERPGAVYLASVLATHHPLIQHVLQRIVNRRACNCDFFCQLIGRHGLRTDQCHINLCFQP